MAATLPPGGISLRGAADPKDLKAGSSSGILLKLGDDVLEDVRKTSREKRRLHFVTGATPKLRIGTRLIDLTLSCDDFRNELFASTSPAEFTFTSVISHRAEVKADRPRASDDTSGSDAALAALQNSLASLKQEKEAKQVSITNSVIPTPKNRYEAARQEKLSKKGGRSLLNNSARTPTIGTQSSPHLGAAPTSAPASDEDLKLRAIKTPLIHLLAIEPLRLDDIAKKTHIPREDLNVILQRVGKQSEGKWQLSDKAFRDLDVWKFEYPSQEKRQSAIDNAIRAYDRQRVDKDSPLWQLLLPKEDRGKGKVLSRLHLGAGQINRGQGLTPSCQPSPVPHTDNESRVASGVNTPRLGASTPRPGSSKGDVMKRLLSKDPQKARAAEDAKEKKRKEREAAASDREGGKPSKKQATTKKTNVKSEEFVHSSDDESDAESVKQKPNDTSRPSPEKTKPPAKSTSKAVASSSSDSSDTALKDKVPAKPAAKNKPPPKATESSTKKSTKPAATGKATPQSSNNLSAPSSQQRNQRSPSNGNRPNAPSPLGTARPRVASDVSDRGAVGVQKVRQGAETPKGLGITNGVRKPQDTSVKKDPSATNKSNKKADESKPVEKQQKPTTNGPATPKTNGAPTKPENTLKRKPDDSATEKSTPKHRKIDSATTNTTQPQTPHLANDSKDPDDAVDLSFSQGVREAQHFKTYYAAYAKEYDRQHAADMKGVKVPKEERDRLLTMHGTLERMKREIRAAGEKESRGLV